MITKEEKIKMIDERIFLAQSLLNQYKYKKDNFSLLDKSIVRFKIEGLEEEIERLTRLILAYEAYKQAIDQ